jgi:hypothetical protein
LAESPCDCCDFTGVRKRARKLLVGYGIATKECFTALASNGIEIMAERPVTTDLKITTHDIKVQKSIASRAKKSHSRDIASPLLNSPYKFYR